MSAESGTPDPAETILSQVETGKLPPHRAARKLLFQTGDIAAAQRLARKTYKQRPRALEHEEIGNIYLQAGDDFLARAVFRAGLLKYGHLQTTNLIHADVPVARAFVDDLRKLLYIPIPKCASSTIKNYISFGLTGETFKETVHRKFLSHYRFVTPEDLQTRYGDYFKFAVVRDPVDRVASYYARNISSGAIRRNAYRVEDFRGIPTMPSAEEFVAHFTAYRRYFLGVRHHTDKQIKYIEHFLKPETGLQVYGMGGVPTIRAHLSEAFGKAISDERFMVTDRKSAEKKRDPVWNDLRDHYKRDLTVFSAILAGDGDPAQPYVLTPRHKDTPCYFQDPTEPGDAADLDSGWTMQEDDDDMLDPAFEPTRSDRR